MPPLHSPHLGSATRAVVSLVNHTVHIQRPLNLSNCLVERLIAPVTKSQVLTAFSE